MIPIQDLATHLMAMGACDVTLDMSTDTVRIVWSYPPGAVQTALRPHGETLASWLYDVAKHRRVAIAHYELFDHDVQAERLAEAAEEPHMVKL